MPQDFKKVLLDVGKQLSAANLEHLNFFFDREVSSDDSSIKLFQFLISNDIISERNVSKLVEALNSIPLPLAAEELLTYENSLNTSSTVERGDVFIGRRDELDDMECHLDDIRGGSYGFRTIFVSGLPGVGKTSLVQEFQRRESLTRCFDRMFISCRGLKTALSLKNYIMEHFGISIDRENLFKIFERMIRGRNFPNTLIVLDNLEEVMEHDSENFNRLVTNICEAGRKVNERSHCLLMTSRRCLSSDVERKLGDTLLNISLENMNERDSLELLGSYLGKRCLEMDEKKKLMKLCGQHTLSMALVASRLKHSPQVPFDLVADEMKRRPLVTLTNIEDLEFLNTRCCVENSLYHTFESMTFECKDLLIRLSIAADSIKETTAKRLYRDLTCSVRDAFSESLMQLLELNFVKSPNFGVSTEGTRRFFIHLLIRTFVANYCTRAECPEELKIAYTDAQDLLRLEYVEEMKRLSKTEWQQPSRYNREIQTERNNLIPQIPSILDSMVVEDASLNDLNLVCNMTYRLFHAPKERANLLLDRKKGTQRQRAPIWALAFFELRLADEMRLAGDYEQARQGLERAKELLNQKAAPMTSEQRDWLDANYDRFYGRYLKDQGSGDYKRALKKSVRYLKDARKKFSNETLFRDVPKYLAEVLFDLGNAYKVYGDNDMCDRHRLYKSSKEAFDAARIIYEQTNPQIVALFDVYLSLAACEMELKSLLTSVDGREDRQTLAPAIEFYNKAEEVAKKNPHVIENDGVKMGYMYYSRSICHTRARDYRSAFVDIQKSLRLRTDALGQNHPQIMNCYMLLADIYSRDHETFTRHNKRAFDAANKAMIIAQNLAWRGANVHCADLEQLLNQMIILCFRLDKDYGPYETIIKAVMRRDLAKLDPKTKEIDFESDDENSKLGIVPTPAGYQDSSSDSDGEEEDGKAPPCSAARDLSDELKELMASNAERLEYLSHEMKVVDMEILVGVLRSGYPNMPSDVRNARYEKGKRLYSLLINLRENPGTVIEANRKAKK